MAITEQTTCSMLKAELRAWSTDELESFAEFYTDDDVLALALEDVLVERYLLKADAETRADALYWA